MHISYVEASYTKALSFFCLIHNFKTGSVKTQFLLIQKVPGIFHRMILELCFGSIRFIINFMFVTMGRSIRILIKYVNSESDYILPAYIHIYPLH